MKKTVAFGLLIVCLTAIGAGVFYLLYIVPQQAVVAEPAVLVVVPRIFERYAQGIQQADQIIRNHPELFRDAGPLTLANLYGFFDIPLKQTVRIQQLRVPGDPREYRKGIHQGIDFYETRRGDAVYAAAPGVVIRVDSDYQPLEIGFRNEMLAKCLSTWNGTPGSVKLAAVEEPYGDVLDKLRGRQVLVYHGQNAQNDPVISLYAHLLDVNAELALYNVVDTNTLLGHIGNSGTSGEVENKPGQENHLHLELFVGGMYWTPKNHDEIGAKQGASRYRQLQQMILDELSQQFLPSQSPPGQAASPSS